MKKIDMHAHVVAFPEYTALRADGKQFLTVEEQFDVWDKVNVEKGVLLPVVAPEAFETLMSNQEAKLLADKYPDRFIWFCNVDPRVSRYSEKTDLSWFLNQYKEMGAKGLGELTTPLDADSPMMDNLFTHCEACEMPVLFHIAPQHGGTYGIVDEAGLPRIERMVKKHSNLKFIGHSAAFWSEISVLEEGQNRNGYPKGKVVEGKLPKLMREYGNLYCDLSAGSGSNAMMRDPEYAAKFMEEFSDRIVYGIDVCTYSTNTFQYTFDEFLTKMVEDKMLSAENYEKICRSNAERILGL
nr:amidohydrolase family protein [Clostridia bacterium]